MACAAKIFVGSKGEVSHRGVIAIVTRGHKIKTTFTGRASSDDLDLLARVKMAATTQIGYEVEEVVLQRWLTKHFGPQFNSRGAMVWTYSVSPPAAREEWCDMPGMLTPRQSELRESTSWWIVTGPRLIDQVRFIQLSP